MNIVDPILLFLISLFALRGYFKGFFRESLSLLGLGAGVMVAVRYDEPVAALLANHWNVSPIVLRVVVFVALFFVVYFAASLFGWLLHRFTKLLFLQTLNRVGGIMLGTGKGAAVLALMVFFIGYSSWLPEKTRQRIDESYLAPALYQLAESLIRIGKESPFFGRDRGAQEREVARYF